MHYVINVSKNGIHYFATAEHSLPTLDIAEKTYLDFKKRFPAEEGFKITLVRWIKQGETLKGE